MAGEVGCRLQAPVLLRRPVLKKIHSCLKCTECLQGKAQLWGRRCRYKEERILPASQRLPGQGEAAWRHQPEQECRATAWVQRALGHLTRHQLSATWGLPMGETGGGEGGRL